MTKLTVDNPPSLNHYLRGRVYKTEIAKNYTDYVRWHCIANGLTNPTDKKVSVTLRWFRERNQGDLDNYMKVILDSIQGFIYKNDSQVYEIHAYKMEVDKEQPRMELEIEVIKK